MQKLVNSYWLLVNRLKIFFILLIACRLLFVEVNAQDTLTVKQLLDSIEQNNLKVKVFDSEIAALNEKVFGVKNQPFANMMLGPGIMPGDMGLMPGGKIEFSQMWMNPKKLSAMEEMQKINPLLKDDEKQITLQQLRLMGKMAYYKRQVLEKELEIMSANAEVLKLMILLAENRLPLGQAKLQDILKSKTELSALQNDISETQKQIDEVNIAMNSLMNREVNIKFPVSPLEKIYYATLKLDSLTELALSKRKEFMQLRDMKTMKELEMKVNDVSKKPDFGISTEWEMPIGSFEPNLMIMGAVSFPLFKSSLRHYESQKNVLKYEMESIDNMKLETENMIRNDIATILSKISATDTILKNYEKNIIPLAEYTLKTTQSAYERGDESLFMYLENWLMLQHTQMEYYDKLMEKKMLHAELVVCCGIEE